MRKIIKKIKWALTPKSERRYTVYLVTVDTRFRAPSRVGAHLHGGVWSNTHGCYLFNQACAEWHCYTRNRQRLEAGLFATVERVI